MLTSLRPITSASLPRLKASDKTAIVDMLQDPPQRQLLVKKLLIAFSNPVALRFSEDCDIFMRRMLQFGFFDFVTDTYLEKVSSKLEKQGVHVDTTALQAIERYRPPSAGSGNRTGAMRA